jgi:hypothetical protein
MQGPTRRLAARSDAFVNCFTIGDAVSRELATVPSGVR